jgi:hypothetical protein
MDLIAGPIMLALSAIFKLKVRPIHTSDGSVDLATL